jgi:polyisoprenoid-binding protein YceI
MDTPPPGWPRRAQGTLCGGAAALAVVVASSAVHAQDPPIRYNLDGAATRIHFEAGASLGSFDGMAGRVVGWADVTDLTRFEAIGRVDVDVASFRTGIGLRDSHLRSDLRAREYPWITFVLGRVAHDGAAERVADVGITEAEGTPVLLLGGLTVRDTTIEVAVPAKAATSGDTLFVRGRLRTRFTQLGLEPSSRLLGLARVHDEILLVFDAVFLRERLQ